MSIKKYSKAILSIMALSLFMYSCTEESSKFPGFETTSDGLYYQFHTHGGDTLKPQLGDLLSTYMDYRTDDTIFNTTPKGQPFNIPLMESTYAGDVFAALAMMSAGDSATFMINADSFFLKTVGAPRPEFLDSNSYFYLDIKVSDVKTTAQIDKERMEKSKEMADAELGLIENYIAENKLTIEKDASGVYFSEVKAGKGAAPAPGSFAKMNIKAVTLFDVTRPFFDTQKNGGPIDFEIGTGRLGIGFESGIAKMSKGGKAIIIAPFELGFGAQGMQGGIPPYATLVYEVELVDIISAEQMQAEQEKKAMQAQAKSAGEIITYMKQNNITVKPTNTGLYYNEKVEGAGKQAVAGKRVKVHYTGTLLNGTKFDSSVDRGQPFEFTLGKGEVIQGWDQGIALMKEGGRAQLIIPSHLGYGERGSGQVIPPNSTLLFDVELIEVID